MKKLLAAVLALSALVAVAPATAITPEQPRVEAAKGKKKKKKRVRYKISINFESKSEDVTDCKSTTEQSLYRIKDSTTTETKWSETGYYPGSSRRTGYRQTTIRTESNDPYVPSDEQKLPRQEIKDFFNGDHWDFQINARRTKMSYDWEDAAGDIEDVVMPAPTKSGRSTTKKLTDTWRSPDKTDEDGRCTSWSERSVTEQVTIKRVDY